MVISKFFSIFMIISIIISPISTIGPNSNVAKSETTTVLVIGSRYDNAISISLKALDQSILNLKIVDYRDFQTLKNSQISNLIILGHGVDLGIIEGNSLLISWNEIGFILSQLNVVGQYYFLNCNVGDEIYNSIPKSKIGFAYDNNIDALAGSLLVTAYILIKTQAITLEIFKPLLSKLIQRVNEIKSHPNLQIFLGLSSNEGGLSAAALFITMAVQALFIWG